MNDEVKKSVEAVGAIAELAFVFYRAVIGQGATLAEAANLTQAYMVAMFVQGNYGPPQEETEGSK